MMHVLRNRNVWALGLIVTALGAAPAAQQAAPAAQPQAAPPAAAPPEATPAAVPVPAAQITSTYVVGQAEPPVEPGAAVVSLSLEEAMGIALERNLDLQSARLNPQNVDYQLQSARAAWLPQYTANYSYRNSTSPSNNTLEGVSAVTNNSQSYNASVSQSLPWFGSSVSASFNNSRQATNNVTARLNPSYNSSLSFSYQMPLLRNLLIDNNRNALRTLAIQRQIADTQLLTQIENTKASVRSAYWQLRQTIEQIEIARRALAIAQQQYQDSLIRVEIGTAAPIDTAQFEVGVASSEQSLLNATINWRNAELNLKRLLASGPDDEIYRATINPTEQPALSLTSVDIASAIQQALANRNDIVQSRRQLEIEQLNLDVTREQTKPNLNLSAGFNSSGQGGNRLQDGVVVDPGGYGDALRALRTFDTSGWNMGLNLQLPFGQAKRTAEINLARAQLSLQQTQTELKAQELTITAQVTNAGLAVENTYKQLQQAQKSREAQERTAEAARTRNEVGLATNFEVVQQLNALTSSRLTELSRLIAYLNAVAEFDRIVRVGGGGGGGN
jgi:outer membrane protein TolC